MIIDNPVVSGSLNVQNNVTASNGLITNNLTVEGTIYGAISGSSATASYVEYENVANKPTLVSSSAQLADDISGSFTSLSSSLSTRLTDDEGSISSLNAASSSYLLNTTGTLTGDLTVTGTLTAQDLVVQEVTSSIIFSSGSNRFGNELTNSHNFTGSVNITGSLNVNGAEVGTGKLDETVFNAYTSSTDTRLENLEATGSDQESRIDTLEGKTLISSSAQIGTEISGAFDSVSSSIASNIEDIIDGTTTVASASHAVSSLTASYALNAGAGAGFPFSGSAIITGSLEVSGSTISGSFIGDGSGLTGITVSSTNTVTSSFSSTGSVTILHSFNSKNVSVSVYDDNDILIIPQQVTLLDNNNVKIDFGGNTTGFAVLAKGGHLVSGSVPVPQLSTVTDSFSSTTSHTVTHNFNTKEVIVSVYEGDTYIIPDSITTPTLNTVTVTFPEAVTGRVVVVKAGHIVSGSIPFDNLLSSPFEQSTLAVTSSKHIVPSLDQTYDLGSPILRFRDLYLSSASIFLGNTVISEDNVVTTASLASVLPDNVVSSSAQIASDISGSFTELSSSLEQRVSANEGSVSSLNSASSSYLLNSTDTLDGDLTVTGKITAQEFHTEFVSASILYQSGSTKFGNSADDTHIFTGNVGIGVDSPDYKLRIDASDDTQLKLNRTGVGAVTLGVNADGGLSIADDGTDRLVVDENGNVGIGTDSPATRLNLKEANTGTEGFIIANWNNTQTVKLGSDNTAGGGKFTLATNGGTANVFLSAYSDSYLTGGNVGIGTTNPGSKLTVNTASAGDGALRLGVLNQEQYVFETGITGVTNAALTLKDVSTPYTYMTFRGGYVGIGTTSPQVKLDVQTDANSTQVVRFWNPASGASAHSAVRIASSANNANSARLEFSDANYYTATISGDRTQGLYFRTSATGADPTAIPVRMVIDTGGNVGIGTTSAGSRLSILGDNSGNTPLIDLKATGTGPYQRGVRLLNSGMNVGDHIMYAVGQADGARNMGQTYFYYAGAGSTSNRISMGLHSVDDVFNILGTGNVGINVTSPTKTLDVNGAIRSRNSFNLSDGTTQIGGLFPYKAITGAGTDNSTALFAETGLDLHFMTNGSVSSKMLINTAGNVGISTTSPSEKLHVVGNQLLTGNLYLAGNSNTRISGNGSGEVGINYATSNTSTYSLSVYDSTSRVFGVEKGGDIYIAPGATYSQTYTYADSWASSFQDVVPTGTLNGNRVYLFTIWTSTFGQSPYYAAASTIITTATNTNSGGNGPEVDLITAHHVGSTSKWQLRMSTALNSDNGVQVKLLNGPTGTAPSVYVRVTEISYYQ